MFRTTEISAKRQHRTHKCAYTPNRADCQADPAGL